MARVPGPLYLELRQSECTHLEVLVRYYKTSRALAERELIVPACADLGSAQSDIARRSASAA